MRFVIQIVGNATGRKLGFEGEYISHFDPDAFLGWGRMETTAHISQALHFDSHARAFQFWQQQSQSRPVRPDGQPNHPLTAYHVEIVGVLI